MLMLKILIVEDEESIRNLYQIALKKEGFSTVPAANGQDAWKIMENQHIDLIITDIMMPLMDGYEFVQSIREHYPLLPVLMITAKSDFSSKQTGFLLGTDDYMTKPVDLGEMILRVRALLRRANIATSRRLCFHDTLLDYDSLTVSYGESQCSMPPKEFFTLYKLLSYPGKIFTRKQLMEEIWGLESSSDSQTVDVHINRLRRRFEDNKDFEIQTIRGLGYKAVIKP